MGSAAFRNISELFIMIDELYLDEFVWSYKPCRQFFNAISQSSVENVVRVVYHTPADSPSYEMIQLQNSTLILKTWNQKSF